MTATIDAMIFRGNFKFNEKNNINKPYPRLFLNGISKMFQSIITKWRRRGGKWYVDGIIGKPFKNFDLEKKQK